jgi:hypothetical protein
MSDMSLFSSFGSLVGILDTLQSLLSMFGGVAATPNNMQIGMRSLQSSMTMSNLYGIGGTPTNLPLGLQVPVDLVNVFGVSQEQMANVLRVYESRQSER